MAIFRRKEKTEVVAPPEGNANLAKQVGGNTLTLERPQSKPTPIPDTDRSDVIYTFTTTLSPHGKRSTGWYVGLAIFFAIVVAINVWLQFWLSAVVIVLAATLLFTQAAQPTKKAQVKITRGGLTINEREYPWHEFEKFWILYEPPQLKRLHLLRRGRTLSELTIELGDEQPLKIRDLLLAFVTEDPTREESRIDFVGRTFKL